MLQKSSQIDRSKVNLQQVNAREIPKSGFDMSYKSYHDFILGRLHVGGYQHTMPGDSFRGSNTGKLTFNKLVTPVMSSVEVCSHNFFMPYRSVDTTFEDAFSPSQLNEMSRSWTAPSFTLRSLVIALSSSSLFINEVDEFSFVTNWLTLLENISAPANTPITSLAQEFQDIINDYIINPIEPGRPSGRNNRVHIDLTAATMWNDFYMADVAQDLNNYVDSLLPSWSQITTWGDVVRAIFQYLTPFIGENSLLDNLGYNYMRRFDVENILVRQESGLTTILNELDDIPLVEYSLRIYYAIWYEYYRDVNLEPRSAQLPNYRQFGSSSVVEQYPIMLLTRVRSWQRDLFIGSMPDDPFRHVFAPVLIANGQDDVTMMEQPYNYERAELVGMGVGDGQENNHGINSQTIYFVDKDGNEQKLVCPLPTIVNGVLTNGDESPLGAYRLDLCNLRRSQMLERYLKRNFYFGDEYKDRMRAHYNSEVSDNRVNRPHLLSSSVQSIDAQQEVSSIGYSADGAEVAPGERTITATAGLGNDTYTFFGEEFGMVMNIISVMPQAQYAGLCPVLLQSKVVDYPIPEFAGQMAELGRVMEIASSGLRKAEIQKQTFGHYPYAHAYRGRVNEVHGSYLSDKQDYTFRRFFGMSGVYDIPQLNYGFIHCRPNIGMFENDVLLDGQLYGELDHEFYVERVLPSPVEEI